MDKEIREIAQRLGDTVAKKNQQYGNSWGKSASIMMILYPNGIMPNRYHDSLLVVRILDKLCRIATNETGDIENPFEDIAGYGMLGSYLWGKPKDDRPKAGLES